MIWGAAILTGLLGSLHCLGMCGPLVMALPQSSGWNALIYHLFRILAYAILGTFIGAFGWGLDWSGMQQGISIAAGVLMIVLGLGLLRKKGAWPPFFLKLYQKWSKRTGIAAAAGMGFLNGLLPCGMVYVAMSGALATASLVDGALYMVLFGLGTWPMMLAISWSKKLWKPTWRLKAQKIVPILTVMIGLLFIVRGMNLGIPYFSPKMNNHDTECCSRPS
ncbi:MAG: sulfite exporter TauE/SafE family protein [Bacteroidetes bacterium]|nr:MAG: sulfite exporter TauE/SafE family protein [Bacteroidota bacterium]